MRQKASYKSRIACLIIIILMAQLVYFNSLKGSFQFDDPNYLSLPETANLKNFWEKTPWQNVSLRPFLLLTFAFNNDLRTNEPFGFHLLNLLAHILVCILIFHILWRTQKIFARHEDEPGVGALKDRGLVFPFCAAALFALHPLNTDTVSYIASRSGLLATLFYLISLLAFIAIFSCREKNPRWLQAALALACGGAFILALASKLIAATLPAILILWFLVILCRDACPRLYSSLLKPANVYGLAAGLAVLALAVWAMIPEQYLSPVDHGGKVFGRWSYFLLQAKVIVFYYLKLFFLPVNLNVDVGFPFSSIGSDWRVAASIFILVGGTAWALIRGNLYLKLGAAWFILALAPTSSFVPLSDLAVEHRTYLPMTLGLIPIAAWGLASLNKTQRTAFVVVMLGGFALLTAHRNDAWTGEFNLWRDAAAKSPHSPRALNNLGKAHYDRATNLLAQGKAMTAAGELDRAALHFERSIAVLPDYSRRHYNYANLKNYVAEFATPELKKELGLAPDGASGSGESKASAASPGLKKFFNDFAEPHYNLASVYLDKELYVKAREQYLATLRNDPGHYAALLGLGSVYKKTVQYEKALEYYLQSIESVRRSTGAQDYSLARLNMGETYGLMEKYPQAIEQFETALHFAPNMFLAHYNLGLVYARTGEFEKAETSYKAALKSNPKFVQARFNLGKLYQARRNWEASIQVYEDLLAHNGPDPRALFNIAWCRQQLGQWEKARDNYLAALTLNPNYATARINLAGVYTELKQLDAAIQAMEVAVRQQPNHFVLNRQLGLLYWEQGKQKIKALQYLDRALALSPSQHEAEQVERLIDELTAS